MLAVVTAVTGAAIPNVNGALAEVHQVTGDVKSVLGDSLGTKEEAKVHKLVGRKFSPGYLWIAEFLN